MNNHLSPQDIEQKKITTYVVESQNLGLRHAKNCGRASFTHLAYAAFRGL